MKPVLLDVQHLVTSFTSDSVKTVAVEDVSFQVHEGETVGIVGESGSGKSVTSMSVMRLIEAPSGKIESGTIMFNGRNLLELSEKEMQKVRGHEISMIFQEPTTSLNPTKLCGDQIAESIIIHQGKSKDEAHKMAVEMLRLVGIPLPEQRANEYPHQLSGGMRQRVMIAIALSCSPKLLIADEPTTALDVTIQAQILKLMRDLKEKMGMSIMLITHDLGVVAEMSEKVIVMYLGKIVEEAEVVELFKNPKH
ncbi:MAG: ABC transporter ATP-binding protein, partial [Clostridia bacterium]|nr:ABC transporter ATP-binding protein [Clostridia bacterium]